MYYKIYKTISNLKLNYVMLKQQFIVVHQGSTVENVKLSQQKLVNIFLVLLFNTYYYSYYGESKIYTVF